MSFDEADDVPEARSLCSTSRTFRPRPAASRAMPAPLIPPPIIATSKSAIVLVLAAGMHSSQRQVTVQADAVEQDDLSSNRHPALPILFAHDHFRKPDATFRDHALE